MVTLRETLEALCAPHGLAVLGVVEDEASLLSFLALLPLASAEFCNDESWVP